MSAAEACEEFYEVRCVHATLIRQQDVMQTTDCCHV